MNHHNKYVSVDVDECKLPNSTAIVTETLRNEKAAWNGNDTSL